MVMRLRIPAPRWFNDDHPEKEAHCSKFPISREYDPWFGIGESMDEAMDVCNGVTSGVVCPIRDKCLKFALTNNCSDGIWGGMYEHDRTALRRRDKKKDEAWKEEHWVWHAPTPLPESVAG